MWAESHDEAAARIGKVASWLSEVGTAAEVSQPASNAPASIAEALKCAAFLRSAEDSALGAARHAQPPKLMVLVVHGDLIDTLLQGLLGSPCRFMHYNTAQSLLECSPDGRWTVYFLNRAEHVGEGMRTGDEMISAAN